MLYMNYNKPLGLLAEERYKKVFMGDFVKAFSLISDSKQLNVCLQVLLHLDGRNKLSVPKTTIAKEAGVCYTTVQNTFKKLCLRDIMRKMERGRYMFNPNLVVSCHPHVKKVLLEEYAAIGRGIQGGATPVE